MESSRWDGREHGKWTVLVSPSHWATIEVAEDNDNDQTQKQGKDGEEDQAQDT
jgi:hypothetical protein